MSKMGKDSFFVAIINNNIDLVKWYLENDEEDLKQYDYKIILNMLYDFKDYDILKELILSKKIDKSKFDTEQYIKLKMLFTDEDIKTLDFEIIINL